MPMGNRNAFLRGVEAFQGTRSSHGRRSDMESAQNARHSFAMRSCASTPALYPKRTALGEYLFQPDKNNSGGLGRPHHSMWTRRRREVRGNCAATNKCIDRSFHLAKFVQLEVENSGKSCHVSSQNRQKKTGPNLVIVPKINHAKSWRRHFSNPLPDGNNFFRLVLPNPRHITEMDLRAMLDRMDVYGKSFNVKLKERITTIIKDREGNSLQARRVACL